MIKSLLGEDENIEKKETPKNKGDKQNSTQNSLFPTDETQDNVKTEDAAVDTSSDEIESIDEIKTAIETGDIPPKEISQTVQPFEVEKPIGQQIVERKTVENQTANNLEQQKNTPEDENSSRALELEKKLREIEKELEKEKELETQRLKKEVAEAVKVKEQEQIQQVKPVSDLEVETIARPKQEQEGDWGDWDKSEKAVQDSTIQIKPKDFVPETMAEGVRKMGMAWSAVVAFVGSIIFMIILGWGADLMLGTQPWGIVVGVILGASIGFFQLIKTTSQIFKPKPNDFDKVSLKNNLETVDNNKVQEFTENIGNKSEEKIDDNLKEITGEKDTEMSNQKVIKDNEIVGGEEETIANTDS